jgi:hypothetical protein
VITMRSPGRLDQGPGAAHVAFPGDVGPGLFCRSVEIFDECATGFAVPEPGGGQQPGQGRRASATASRARSSVVVRDRIVVWRCWRRVLILAAGEVGRAFSSRARPARTGHGTQGSPKPCRSRMDTGSPNALTTSRTEPSSCSMMPDRCRRTRPPVERTQEDGLKALCYQGRQVALTVTVW